MSERMIENRPDPLLSLKELLNQREDNFLSPFAVRSVESSRRRPEPRQDTEHRQNFAIDADRILHSKAFTRYIGKTQVFYLIRNDHISHRVIHVQLLSKIARTIGRLLRLNEDLIEAISLGHDIGHPPFGHDGESMLSEIGRKRGLSSYLHNVQGVRFLNKIERNGRGWNLSLQVLDGVLCHNGEVLVRSLGPRRGKTFDDLDREMKAQSDDPDFPLIPTTLEGCVVRLCDVISYVGRDFEDAIQLNLITREELPPRVREGLGATNGAMVYTLVDDLIRNSLERDAIGFGARVSGLLGEFLDFNRERIYYNPKIKTEREKIRRLYENLFEYFLDDLRHEDEDSSIYRDFLKEMDAEYRKRSPEEIVRDFIAGMTDDYFLDQGRMIFLPQNLPSRFS